MAQDTHNKAGLAKMYSLLKKQGYHQYQHCTVYSTDKDSMLERGGILYFII